MTIVIIATIALVGLKLITVGWGGLRRGTAPHCRKCDFELTGLIGPEHDATERVAVCPECGSALGEKRAIARGRRRRSPALIISGAVLILLAGGAFTLRARAIDWLRIAPTWVVMRQAQSDSIWRAGEAAAELERRLHEDRLSDERLAQFFGIFLAHAEAGVTPFNQDSWAALAAAHWDISGVSETDRDRYLRVNLSSFRRVQPSIREIYLATEPFPFREPESMLYPDPIAWEWLVPGRVVGMAAYLKSATLDGKPVALDEAWHGTEWNGTREGWSGSWISVGTPTGNGGGPALVPEPVSVLPLLSPGVGVHELRLTWRIDAFLLGESEAAPLEHPYREPDTSWNATTTHTFEVVGSMAEIVPIIHADDPNAPPPPQYRGPDEGLSLYAQSATKLHRDGDWYFHIRGQLLHKPAPPEASYVVMARIHLEIDGKPYKVAEWRGISDIFYDRINAPPLDQSSAVSELTSFRLNIIDLPRVDRCDIVLTPAPELIIQQPIMYDAQAVWGDPIIIRDVPIDWSGIGPTPPGTEPAPPEDTDR